MSSQLPAAAEEVRRKYLHRFEEAVHGPARADVEARRQRVLEELHALEASTDPLLAADKKMMELGLQKQLEQIDAVEAGLNRVRDGFAALGPAQR